MGDSGEGLVDAEARIQERIEELQKERDLAQRPAMANLQNSRKLESLKLAWTELKHQADKTTHPARKNQIEAALADLERKMGEIRIEPAGR